MYVYNSTGWDGRCGKGCGWERAWHGLLARACAKRTTPHDSAAERIFEQARGGAVFWVWVFLAVREGVRLILWYEQPPVNYIRQHRFGAPGAVEQLGCRFCAGKAPRRPQRSLWTKAE
ncbi:hypothetical protein E4U45_005577 [Claviceps purpurea]|nr:hypothetical protein E4U45_005577 [Claviceps purpurea]